MKDKSLIGILLLFVYASLTTMSYAADEEILFWYVDEAEAKIKSKIMKIEYKATPQGILDLILPKEKGYHPKVLLVKNEYAYINIEGDSEYITERSGSSGAAYFAATVVFNLTEFDDISYVYFVDEGDHFASGDYERIDFWWMLEQEEKRKYKDYIEEKLSPRRGNVMIYVEYLKEIGDRETIEELQNLKRITKSYNYEPCKMTRERFEELIGEAIYSINERLKK